MTKDNYSLQKAGGYFDRLAVKKRREMFILFKHIFPENNLSQVLDVGITADKLALSSNYFEKYFTRKDKIIALSNQDGHFLEEVYPGLRFQQGDAKHLPFDNNSIDVVFSSAVIEHIGNFHNQKQMIAECVRVAKQGVFITTPNRWHPLEVHTMLPLMHWLPKSAHRFLLRTIGFKFYAQEDNLNLLDRQRLKQICQQLQIHHFSIKGIKTFGFESNLILIVKKY